MEETHSLRAGLRSAWNRKLYCCWRSYNQDYLSGVLQEPLIRVGKGQQLLGQWDGERRVLTISEDHVLNDPWPSVTDTLRHEMAHQYVDEVLGANHEPPHGPSFQDTCRRLHCHAEARTQLNRPAPNSEDDRMLRRLKKVLSLADSPNRHEAQAAVEKARYLLSRYSIDLVELDREREFGSICLGRVKGRHMAYELWLATILNDFFFVEVLWAQSYDARRDRSGSVLQIFGTHAHLEMAEYVYFYLSQVMARLWLEYRRDQGLTSNRRRQRFLAGVAEGFYHKLRCQERTLQRSQALVWKGDPRLEAYFRFLNPHVETRYWGGKGRCDQAYREGLRQGRQLRITRPIEESPSRVLGQLVS